MRETVVFRYITVVHARAPNELHMFHQSVLESRVGYSVRRIQNFEKMQACEYENISFMLLLSSEFYFLVFFSRFCMGVKLGL
jgi:hypothetical protein